MADKFKSHMQNDNTIQLHFNTIQHNLTAFWYNTMQFYLDTQQLGMFFANLISAAENRFETSFQFYWLS